MPLPDYIIRELEEQAYGEIKRNFDTESFYGEKWEPRAFEKKFKPILIDTGDLYYSIDVKYNEYDNAFDIKAEDYGFQHQTGMTKEERDRGGPLPQRKWMTDVSNKKSKIVEKLAGLLTVDIKKAISRKVEFEPEVEFVSLDENEHSNYNNNYTGFDEW